MASARVYGALALAGAVLLLNPLYVGGLVDETPDHQYRVAELTPGDTGIHVAAGQSVREGALREVACFPPANSEATRRCSFEYHVAMSGNVTVSGYPADVDGSAAYVQIGASLYAPASDEGFGGEDTLGLLRADPGAALADVATPLDAFGDDPAGPDRAALLHGVRTGGFSTGRNVDAAVHGVVLRHEDSYYAVWDHGRTPAPEFPASAAEPVLTGVAYLAGFVLFGRGIAGFVLRAD